MPTLGDLLIGNRLLRDQRPRFVRDGEGQMTGEGRKGDVPRRTHGSWAGRTRAEKRANYRTVKAALIKDRRAKKGVEELERVLTDLGD